MNKSSKSAPKFEDDELFQILLNAKQSRNLLLAPTSASNAKEKDAIWLKITDDVNSVSRFKRETCQIKKKWSDWNYNMSKSRKKNLSNLDKELITLLNETRTGEHDDRSNDAANLAEEKTLLTSLIGKHYRVLFGAFNNYITMELKTKTWQMIADEVNRLCSLNRTVNHLKDKWRKMCTEVRKKAATKNRLERNSSGLNDIEVPQLTDLEEEIKIIIGEISIEGITGGIDTECEIPGEVESCSEGENFHPEEDGLPADHTCDDANTNTMAAGSVSVKPSRSRAKRSYDDTLTLLDLEREKLDVMRKASEIAEKRLEVENKMYKKIDDISTQISAWINLTIPHQPHMIRDPLLCTDQHDASGNLDAILHSSDERNFMNL